MRKLIIMLLALTALAMVAVPVMGCSDTCHQECGWKTVCEQKPYYEANGFKTLGKCVADCRHGEQAYACPITGNCCEIRCKELVSPCVLEWQCRQVCPDPDPTPTPMPTPIPDPVPSKNIDGPYSESIWSEQPGCRIQLGAPVDKVLEGGHSYVATLYYISTWDGIRFCSYHENEQSYTKDCTSRLYWSDNPIGESFSGGFGAATYTFQEPAQRFGILAVVDYQSILPKVLIVRDQKTGMVVDTVITTDQTIQRTYGLTDDLRGCRIG